MAIIEDARRASRAAQTIQRESHRGWHPDQVNLGSLQRIADACELMAKNHADLVVERDVAVAVAANRLTLIDARDRQIAALRGQITKLKKKLGGEWG